jgi:hypothetical protein
MSLAKAKYMDCSCCGPNGVARGAPGALCPLCEDAGCEPFENVCKAQRVRRGDGSHTTINLNAHFRIAATSDA